MELLSSLIVIFLVFAFYIYKISYFYDFRYIGNVIRFLVFYFILVNIVGYVFKYFSEDLFENNVIFSLTIFILCLITSILYRAYLIKKFGNEERFANLEEIEDIGDLKE
ncbi:hypothetical protein G6N05_07320 [Flavobacterium sp. F372]|uniref:DUF2304 domain-containing protein n=1 Tax=Flavobacterium bernardetii TaxID=2813823 RepID=A0ABR7IXE6_9FLAO|nr:hypothetical protein [Flavobacterium bernardetii]MBC5834445.1 hypothetical protein [Flavobacterium bernardetii]NHF69916.1 hypothetical protein [Flavobacterium bernardetii]